MFPTSNSPASGRSAWAAAHRSCFALALVWLCLLGNLAGAEQIINQSFTVDSTPGGWVVQGTTGSPSVPLNATDFYGATGQQDYLRLSSDTANQRASAYYTARTFNSQNFTLTARIYIGGSSPANHGDGLTFSFLDATTIGSNPALLLGAGGDYMGAPRGGSAPGFGIIPGLRGFNFEFDDHRNTGEYGGEYTRLINVSDRSHVAGTAHDYSGDAHFFYDSDWEQVQLKAYDGQIYFSWNYVNGGYLDSYQFAQPSDLHYANTIFGITAGTGTLSANHWVDDIILDSAAGVPEPSFLVLYGLMGLGLPWLRRRKSQTAASTR